MVNASTTTRRLTSILPIPTSGVRCQSHIACSATDSNTRAAPLYNWDEYGYEGETTWHGYSVTSYAYIHHSGYRYHAMWNTNDQLLVVRSERKGDLPSITDTVVTHWDETQPDASVFDVQRMAEERGVECKPAADTNMVKMRGPP